MIKKQIENINITKVISWLVFILSGILFVFLLILKLPHLQLWYEKYQEYLLQLEMKIAELRNDTSVITIVFLLFIIKAVFPVPIVPISCICVIGTMVFGTVISSIINILGLVIIFTIRYYIGVGKKNLPYRVLKNYDEILKFLRYKKGGNLWILFVFRLIPAFPVNTISVIYGSLEYDFRKYLFVSVLGFLPKIISYSIIGHNAFNPFSVSFLIPLIISIFLSGAGLSVTRKIILFIRRKGEEDVKIKN